MPNILAEQYIQWGRKMAKDYTGRGVPLNEALAKLAEEYELNPEQIKRAAEAANIATFTELMPSRDGGDIRFDRADAESLIAQANAPAKLAADRMDYQQNPPRRSPDISRVLAREVAHSPAILPDLEKRASLERAEGHPTRGDVLRVIQVLEKAAQELRVERMGLAQMTKESIDAFKELIRGMVKEGHPIEDLYKAAVLTRPDQSDTWRGLFSEVISNLDARGYFSGGVKTAEPLDPKLISKAMDRWLPGKLKVEVLNGNHPLTLSINNLADMAERWRENAKGMSILQGRIEQAHRVLHRTGALGGL